MKPLTPDEIRRAIDERLGRVAESCNSGFISSTEDVVRGLLWALRGEDPGPYLFRRGGREIYDMAGIPTRNVGKHFHYAMPGTDVEAELSESERCEFCVEEGIK